MKTLLLLSTMVHLLGEFVPVTGGGNGEKNPKLDYKNHGPNNPLIFMLGSSFSGKSDVGEWSAVNVRHEKETKTMFVTNYLKDRLADIPIGSTVRLIFKGKPAGKKYFAFDLAVDTAIPVVADWEARVKKQDGGSEQAAPQTQTPAYVPPATPQAQDISDDLPF